MLDKTFQRCIIIHVDAGMAELVDALVSGTSDFTVVSVRVRSWAQLRLKTLWFSTFFALRTCPPNWCICRIARDAVKNSCDFAF